MLIIINERLEWNHINLHTKFDSFQYYEISLKKIDRSIDRFSRKILLIVLFQSCKDILGKIGLLLSYLFFFFFLFPSLIDISTIVGNAENRGADTYGDLRVRYDASLVSRKRG